MTTNVEIVNTAASLIIKAALLASRFSGRTRKQSLKRLSKMDAGQKDKEIIFLRDKVDQLQMQITILQIGERRKMDPKVTYQLLIEITALKWLSGGLYLIICVLAVQGHGHLVIMTILLKCLYQIMDIESEISFLYTCSH